MMGMFHARQQPALGCGPRLTPECTAYDHAPEFAFEKSLNNVRRAVKDMRSITRSRLTTSMSYCVPSGINVGQRCISQQSVTSRTSETNARMVTLSYCPITTSIDRRRFGWQCRDQPGRGEDLMLLRTESQGLDRRDRGDDFLCGHDGIGIVWDIDVERGVHHLIRVIRRRVLYHRDLVAEFGGKANGRFDAGMRYEPDDDELMDAVFLEL